MLSQPNVETVGSFLLPDSLKEARERFDAGAISANELREAEDNAICALLDKQKAEGLTIASDGEFRRRVWDQSFFAEINGLELTHIDEGRVYQNTRTFTDLIRLVEPISFNPAHPVFDEFVFLKQEAEKRGLTPQIAIPAPAQLYYEIMKFRPRALEVYGSVDNLIEAIADVYRKIIARLYELGARRLQLDDTVWHRLCDPARAKRLLQDGRNIITVTANDLRVNNLSLEGRPADMFITEHVCNNDHDSDIETYTNFTAIADTLFPHLNVDAFHIPVSLTDPDDYTVLSRVPAGKRVVLGIVSSTDPMMESPVELIGAVNEAARYIPRENLAIAPRCGFNCPPKLTVPMFEPDQWNKIKLLQEVASMC